MKIEKYLKVIFLKNRFNRYRYASSLSDFLGISVFLTIFLLFNSSVVSEVVQETIGGDRAISPSISQPRIKREGTIREKITYYGFSYPEVDVRGAEWIQKYGIFKENRKIIVDSDSGENIINSYGMYTKNVQQTMAPPPRMPPNSYFFLRKINNIDNIMKIDFLTKKRINDERMWWNTSEISPILEKNDKIYTNSGSELYYN